MRSSRARIWRTRRSCSVSTHGRDGLPEGVKAGPRQKPGSSTRASASSVAASRTARDLVPQVHHPQNGPGWLGLGLDLVVVGGPAPAVRSSTSLLLLAPLLEEGHVVFQRGDAHGQRSQSRCRSGTSRPFPRLSVSRNSARQKHSFSNLDICQPMNNEQVRQEQWDYLATNR